MKKIDIYYHSRGVLTYVCSTDQYNTPQHAKRAFITSEYTFDMLYAVGVNPLHDHDIIAIWAVPKNIKIGC